MRAIGESKWEAEAQAAALKLQSQQPGIRRLKLGVGALGLVFRVNGDWVRIVRVFPTGDVMVESWDPPSEPRSPRPVGSIPLTEPSIKPPASRGKPGPKKKYRYWRWDSSVKEYVWDPTQTEGSDRYV